MSEVPDFKAIPSCIRDITKKSLAVLKRKLYKDLKSVPDQPGCGLYAKLYAGRSNSLVNQASSTLRTLNSDLVQFLHSCILFVMGVSPHLVLINERSKQVLHTQQWVTGMQYGAL